MLDLSKLTKEHFDPWLETVFVVSSPETGPIEAQLIETSAIGSSRPRSEPGVRQGFALVFRGPAEPALGQGTFTVTHPEAGEMAIFLVPVGADAQGRRYEAVFM